MSPLLTSGVVGLRREGLEQNFSDPDVNRRTGRSSGASRSRSCGACGGAALALLALVLRSIGVSRRNSTGATARSGPMGWIRSFTAAQLLRRRLRRQPRPGFGGAALPRPGAPALAAGARRPAAARRSRAGARRRARSAQPTRLPIEAGEQRARMTASWSGTPARCESDQDEHEGADRGAGARCGGSSAARADARGSRSRACGRSRQRLVLALGLLLGALAPWPSSASCARASTGVVSAHRPLDMRSAARSRSRTSAPGAPRPRARSSRCGCPSPPGPRRGRRGRAPGSARPWRRACELDRGRRCRAACSTCR